MSTASCPPCRLKPYGPSWTAALKRHPGIAEHQSSEEGGAKRGDAKRDQNHTPDDPPARRIHLSRVRRHHGIFPSRRPRLPGVTIEAHTIRYRLETWIGPDGQTLKGRLPISVQGHDGAQLKSYVLY
jgi:hypothetical protein